MNLNQEGKQIKSVTGILPVFANDAEVKIYCNKPNQKVKLYKVAMELGNKSSLY